MPLAVMKEESIEVVTCSLWGIFLTAADQEACWRDQRRQRRRARGVGAGGGAVVTPMATAQGKEVGCMLDLSPRVLTTLSFF